MQGFGSLNPNGMGSGVLRASAGSVRTKGAWRVRGSEKLSPNGRCESEPVGAYGFMGRRADERQKCRRSSATRYSRRHTKWFIAITKRHITPMPSAMRGKSPIAVM